MGADLAGRAVDGVCCGGTEAEGAKCEDGGGEYDYLRILTRDGEIIDFARNSISEFAGACFSTKPNTLFVNIQSASLTLAIWGPWSQLRK